MPESNQSIARKEQGYRSEGPRCGNCKFFTSTIERHSAAFGGHYEKEHYLRCSLGNFAVKKNAHCDEHEFKS